MLETLSKNLKNSLKKYVTTTYWNICYHNLLKHMQPYEVFFGVKIIIFYMIFLFNFYFFKLNEQIKSEFTIFKKS